MLLSIILAVVIPVVVLYLAIPWVQKKVGPDAFDKAKDIAGWVVAVIEQTGKEWTNEEKLAAAIEYAKQLAEWRGIDISDDIIEKLVEGSVFFLKMVQGK